MRGTLRIDHAGGLRPFVDIRLVHQDSSCLVNLLWFEHTCIERHGVAGPGVRALPSPPSGHPQEVALKLNIKYPMLDDVRALRSAHPARNFRRTTSRIDGPPAPIGWYEETV